MWHLDNIYHGRERGDMCRCLKTFPPHSRHVLDILHLFKPMELSFVLSWFLGTL